MPLNDPPALDPKTKEVWSGLRRPSSRRSAAQSLIDALRVSLSGYTGYVNGPLSAADSFDALETALQTTHYDSVQAVSDGEIADTVATLEAAMSWSTYSDGSTGAPSLANYDAYRTFLTDNGVASVDADLHIQTLKQRFTPSYTVHIDRGTITAFDSWEQYCINAGMDSSRAAELRALVEGLYPDFATFDSGVLANDDPLAVILNGADHETSIGEGNLGIHVWESEGTTAHGQTATPGDVSLRYGGTFHAEQVTRTEPVTTLTNADVSYGSLSVDPTEVKRAVGNIATVSTTVTNDSGRQGALTITFAVDGAVEAQDTRTLASGASETVSFVFFSGPRTLGTHTVEIGDAGPASIEVVPGGLLGGIA